MKQAWKVGQRVRFFTTIGRFWVAGTVVDAPRNGFVPVYAPNVGVCWVDAKHIATV